MSLWRFETKKEAEDYIPKVIGHGKMHVKYFDQEKEFGSYYEGMGFWYIGNSRKELRECGVRHISDGD